MEHNGNATLIRKTPNVLGGDARIGDRRIAVWTLVQLRQHLTQGELDTAWQYYETHQVEIDEAIRDNEEA
jgi:uncharacterized protein (DUF433 family)